MTSLNATFEVCGYLRLKIYRPDGSLRVDTDWFRNLITDTGLNMQGDSAISGTGTRPLLFRCSVGAGNTPPTISDTALQTQVATTTTTQDTITGNVTASPWYAFCRKTFRFATGAAAGNLTEVGIFGSLGSNPMLSRALIVDGMGNPITLTVLSDEILDVVYEYRVYPLQADLPFNVTISAVNYSCVARASSLGNGNALALNVGTPFGRGSDQFGNTHNVTVYNGVLGPITGNPTGTSDVINSITATFAAYVPGSFTRSVTYDIPLNEGNISGGIAAVQAPNNVGWYQISFSPAIPKDATKILSLTFTYTWIRRVI